MDEDGTDEEEEDGSDMSQSHDKKDEQCEEFAHRHQRFSDAGQHGRP